MANSYSAGMKKRPEFGTVLRRLRFEKGLSQEALAERAGMVSHAHLCRLESGRKQPTVEMLFRLADALEVPASTIIAEMERYRS
jgi:transcriptional regulator with XRE-family HTH domain